MKKRCMHKTEPGFIHFGLQFTGISAQAIPELFHYI